MLINVRNCLKLQREEDINILNGNPQAVDILEKMSNNRNQVKILVKQHEKYLKNGKINEKYIENDGSLPDILNKFNESLTKYNKKYINFQNDLKLVNYDYLLTILPYFIEENDEINYDNIDDLEKYEQLLFKSLKTIFKNDDKNNDKKK